MESYQILETLNPSSFIRILKCRKKYNYQIVTIKCIDKKMMSYEHLTGLVQEIELLRSLPPHVNVQQVLEYFETDKEICVVSEDVSTMDLSSILQQDQCLPEPVVHSIALQLTKALYHLYSNNVVHGDIAPSNIFVTDSSIIKIADNLTSRLVFAPSPSSIPHRAPELLPSSLDHRSDLYSLGSTLYQLSTGYLPYHHHHNQQQRLDIPINISYELSNLLQGLLVKDIDKRLSWNELLNHPFMLNNNNNNNVQNVQSPIKSSIVNSQSNSADSLLIKKPSRLMSSPPKGSNSNCKPPTPPNSMIGRNPITNVSKSKTPVTSSPPLYSNNHNNNPPIQSLSPKLYPKDNNNNINVGGGVGLIKKSIRPSIISRPQTPQLAYNPPASPTIQSIPLNPLLQFNNGGIRPKTSIPSSGQRPSTPIIIRPLTPSRQQQLLQSPKAVHTPLILPLKTPHHQSNQQNNHHQNNRDIIVIDKLDIETTPTTTAEHNNNHTNTFILPFESIEFWMQQEARSQQPFSRIFSDKLLLQKLLYHLQSCSNTNIPIMEEDNPIGPIATGHMLRTLTNIFVANNSGLVSPKTPSTPSPPPLHTPPTPLGRGGLLIPPVSPIVSPVIVSFNNLPSISSSNIDVLYKRNTFDTLIDILFNLVNQPIEPLTISPEYGQLVSDACHCLGLFLDYSPSLVNVLFVGGSVSNRPMSPLVVSPNSPKRSYSSTSYQSIISQLYTLITIIHHLSKSLLSFNSIVSKTIIKFIDSFFKKIGESPIQFNDVYKKIIDNTYELIYNLCGHFQIDGLPLNYDIIQCLVSFIHTSPTSILEFPLFSSCQANQSNQPTNQSNNLNSNNNQSNLIYQSAGNLIGDGFSKENIMEGLYEMMENPLNRYSVLQLLLHCSRSSRSFAELINRMEGSIYESSIQGVQQRHSLFDHLLTDQPDQTQHQHTLEKSIILLILGNLLMQIPETIEWVISCDLELVIKRFFCNTTSTDGTVLPACASYFLGSFLTVAVNVEKNLLNSNNDLLISTINTVAQTIPLKVIRKLFITIQNKNQQQKNNQSQNQNQDGMMIESIRIIEGGCMARPHIGHLDGCASILLRLLKRQGSEFLEDFLDSGVWESICHHIGQGDCSELSPAGVVYLLRVIYEVVSRNTQHLSYLVKNNLLISLCTLMEPRHIERLREWPSILSGGAGGVSTLAQQIIYTLYLPEQARQQLEGTGDDEISLLNQLIQHIMLDYNLVRNILLVLPLMSSEILDVPVILLSTLILQDQQFALQFINAGGLDPSNTNQLLNSDKNQSSVLGDALLIINQIARVSTDHHKLISKADIFPWLSKLLNHHDSSIRSKTCNLIGNLCKFDSSFNDILSKYELIPILIDRCNDVDGITRKYACIAIGNIACHSDELYEELEGAIKVFTTMLDDTKEDEKTRVNVAGAIGNLVRNSNLLCPLAIESGTLNVMVKHLDNPNLTKNILFSLGNFCIYQECRQILANHLNLPYYLDRLQQSQQSNINQGYEDLSKYIIRINNVLSQ